MPVLQRRGRRDFSDDTLRSIESFIIRRTSGMVAGGFRTDLRRNLAEDEQAELVALTREAEGDNRSFVLARLSKRKQERWERLVGKAGGDEKFFENYRELEQVKAIASLAHRESVRRPLSRREENGVFREIARCIEHDWLGVADVAVLASFIAAFVGGRALGPRSRIELVGDGTVLVIDDAQMGPFSGRFDEEQQIGPRWLMTLANLETNEWLQVVRNGKQLTISPGRRLQLAMAGKPITDAVA